MATYIFKCKSCDTEFEISISPNLVSVFKTICPDCKSKNVARVYIPVPFVFRKFYKTDKDNGK
jgi:putative FmdB family regulatory protein